MKSLSKGLTGLVACMAGAVLTASVHAEDVPAAAAAEEAGADELKRTAERFGIRASVLDISLSPSGTKLAWIGPGPNHSEVLKVFDLESDNGVRTIAGNSEIHADLSRCEWATDERLICQIYGIGKRGDGLLLPFTRMFAIDHDGSDVEQLTERQNWRAESFRQDGGNIVALDVAGEPGQILMTREWIKENDFMTRLANRKEGLGIDRIDVESGKRRIEEQPDDGASFYLADENGVVRFKTRELFDGNGYATGQRVFMFRRRGGSDWEMLDEVTLGGSELGGFSPAAVDGGRNALLAYTFINGYRALLEIPLDGRREARILASRNDVDIDGLLRIGRQRRVVGVSYASEKREVEYFDEGIAQLANGFGRALPNQPLIDIGGASADERRLLVIASSDTDPGTAYLYDKETRQLEQLLDLREFLVDVPMGEMRPVAFPAADGTEIPGYLTLPPGSKGKNLPTIVLPHGGPAARDYWGFDWLVQFFTARGFAVLQPNFRGSAGYGEAWFGRNGYQSWDVAVGDVNDAGRWLVREGIADPDRLAIVGWSYGGYAALQSQVVDPDLYQAVVAIAPVTDLEFLRSDARGYTGFRARDEQLGNGPHIAAGSPRRHADRFKAPVALFHGTLDVNVSMRHSRAMADALQDVGRPVVYREFEDLEHSLDDSKARVDMLTEIGQFLEQAFAD